MDSNCLLKEIENFRKNLKYAKIRTEVSGNSVTEQHYRIHIDSLSVFVDSCFGSLNSLHLGGMDTFAGQAGLLNCVGLFFPKRAISKQKNWLYVEQILSS